MVQFIIIAAIIAIIAAYLLVIEFPGLADVVISACDALVFYLGQAMDIVWLFVPKTATLTLMGLAIAIQIVVYGYKFVMWILRKIPTAGIT